MESRCRRCSRHREAKCERIRAGQSKGLLAYDDESVVGWCNVGPRDAFVNLRARTPRPSNPAMRPPVRSCVSSSTLNTVIAAWRRRYLESADDYLRDLGMATAEGYPRAAPPTDPAFPWTAASYKGTGRCTQASRLPPPSVLDRFLVMRKDL